MSYYINPKQLRTIIPQCVPMDVVCLIDKYLYTEFKDELDKLYEEIIILIINPVFVSKKKFINLMLEKFLSYLTGSFKLFLRKYSSFIHSKGSNILRSVSVNIVSLIYPPIPLDFNQHLRNIEQYVDKSVDRILEKMAKNEGFKLSKYMSYETAVESYLNSLRKL